MKKDLLIKSTLSVAAFSLVIGAGCATISVKGSDSTSLNSEKAIAGLDLSLDNLMTVGGSELYATEIESIIESATQAPSKEVETDKSASDTDDANTTTEQKADNNTAGKDDTANSQDSKDSDDSTSEDKAAAKETAEKKVSEYDNLAISIANDYVNVRKKNSTESEIVGKLYKGCAATILKKGKQWVKIQSGDVKGYINKDYLAIGFDAEELVDTYGTKYATVNTMTLNVREKKSTECKILTQIPVGETYEVIKEYKEWVKISIDDGDIKGYVAKEYVDLSVEFKEAVSIEQERLEAEREAAAREAELELQRKQAEAAAAKAEAEAQAAREEAQRRAADAAAKKKAEEAAKKAEEAKKKAEEAKKKEQNSQKKSDDKKESEDTKTQSTTSGTTGEQIAAYAQKFVGNRYVWGGSSLTNGTDCSGFTMSLYKAFGYSLPHHSGSQARCGTSVSMSNLKAGDLIFYTNRSGTINHVAMYIGGGKVCHASNARDGIKISVYNYRTPYCARRIIN